MRKFLSLFLISFCLSLWVGGSSYTYSQKQTVQSQEINLQKSLRIFSKDSVQNASSSIMEVQTKNQGFAFPLFTSEQRQNIVNPDVGLIVYDTDQDKLYFFDGTLWQGLEITNSKDTFSFELPSEPTNGFGAELIMQDGFAFIAASSQTVSGISYSGAVYYYQKNTENYWILKQTIKPNTPIRNNAFGFSMSYRNDTLVCGANYGVYVFVKNTTGTFIETPKINIPTPTEYAPYRVSLWQNYLAVVSTEAYYPINDDKIYIYKKNGNVWDVVQIITDANDLLLGFSMQLDDGFLFLGNGGIGANAPPDVNIARIHIYKLQNGQFNLFQIIKEGEDDWLGEIVKYHNNKLYAYVINGVNIYTLANNSWYKSEFVSIPNGMSFSHFDVYGDYLFKGEDGAIVDEFANSGRVVIMRKTNTGWIKNSVRTAPDIEYYTWFGRKISVFKQDYIISGYSAKRNKYYVLFGRTYE